MNYIIINKNNAYTEIYDILEDKELFMNNLNDRELIMFHIEKYVEKTDYIKYSNVFNNEKERMDDILMNCSNNKRIDTVLIYSNDDYMFELMYFESNNSETEDDMNHFASIINTEEKIIYGTVYIFKTLIKKNKIEMSIINQKDLLLLFNSIFYHMALMVEENEIKELCFTGNKPFNLIGNTFKETDNIEILNFCFCLYEEENSENYINHKISKLFGREIKGRCFVMMTCPYTYKKFWNLSEKTFNNIINIMNNDDKYKYIESKIHDNLLGNPFMLFNSI
jgi:hypothetical protein